MTDHVTERPVNVVPSRIEIGDPRDLPRVCSAVSSWPNAEAVRIRENRTKRKGER